MEPLEPPLNPPLNIALWRAEVSSELKTPL